MPLTVPSRAEDSRLGVFYRLEEPLSECQLLPTLVWPIDASLGQIVFRPCNLENSPFNYLWGSRRPFSPPPLPPHAFLPLPVAAGWEVAGGHHGPSSPIQPQTGGCRGRNMGPQGERAGFKSRLQIYWRGFRQPGLHLTFPSACP